jgi:hypothetical protein
LAPLLSKRNVELLINVMWNFISLAIGHINQQGNLREIVGDQLESLVARAGAGDGHAWMHAYLNQLRVAAKDSNSPSRLRAAWFPVEFPSQDRVFYFLAYVTHHVKGIIVFLEESEKALQAQKEVKFVVRQQHREKMSGTSDMFGDTLNPSDTFSTFTDPEVRALWLSLLPTIGSELHVNESQIAEMVEDCGCLIATVQSELRTLISEGILKNVDARGTRSKNPVHYRIGETIRRVI